MAKILIIINGWKLKSGVTGHFIYVPLNVKPNPLACQPLRHSTYSEKPPGPAHRSAKYNRSFGPIKSLYNQANSSLLTLSYLK